MVMMVLEISSDMFMQLTQMQYLSICVVYSSPNPQSKDHNID